MKLSDYAAVAALQTTLTNLTAGVNQAKAALPATTYTLNIGGAGVPVNLTNFITFLRAERTAVAAAITAYGIQDDSVAP